MRTRGGVAGDVGVRGRERRVEDGIFLFVTRYRTWSALCPSETAAGVEYKRELLLGRAQADTDDVVSRTKYAGRLGGNHGGF